MVAMNFLNAFQHSAYDKRYLMSVLLQPRSLVLVMDEMYHTYLHGISQRETDTITDSVVNCKQCNVLSGDILKRSTRVSLTIRHVPKVLKAQIRLGKR